MIIDTTALRAPQIATTVATPNLVHSLDAAHLNAMQTAVMPEVQPEVTSEFSFKDHKVRVVMLDGAPWFVATDALRILGMNTAQVSNYLRHLNCDEKQLLRKNSPNLSKAASSWFKYAPSLTLITESGLYKLVMRSDKPEAKAFQDWIARDVLPSIRKTGSYTEGDQELASANTYPIYPPAAPTAPATSLEIEAEFRGLVERRMDAHIKRVQELRFEVTLIENAISRDGQLLKLLAA